MKKLIVSGLMLSATISISISSVLAEGKHEGDHGHDSSHTSSHAEAHWESPKEAAARINPVKSDQASLDRGKTLYMGNCATCHGATANGDGPLAKNLIPKPTNLSIMAGNHSDGDFEWKIAHGKGAMPAWKSTLSEGQRWDLVNYIQTLESPEGKGDMSNMDHSNMSEEEIKAMESLVKDSPSDSDEDQHHKNTNHSHSH